MDRLFPRRIDYHPDRLGAAMAEHHYPLQALLYSVALHRYLRWRVAGYDPALHLGGAAYLFVRGMTGATTPVVDGDPHGVFSWRVPHALVLALSDLLDGAEVGVVKSLSPLLGDEVASLAPFVEAGLLDSSAVHVAGVIARSTGGLGREVLLGAALAARAPRFGHVCIVLETVAETVVVDDVRGDAIGSLPWPDPERWAGLVATSPAVGAPTQRARPGGDILPLVFGRDPFLPRALLALRRTGCGSPAESLRREGGLAIDSGELEAILEELFGAEETDLRQREAAERALTRRLTVVAGGPGTGKTLTIARLLGAAYSVGLARGRQLDVALARRRARPRPHGGGGAPGARPCRFVPVSTDRFAPPRPRPPPPARDRARPASPASTASTGFPTTSSSSTRRRWSPCRSWPGCSTPSAPMSTLVLVGDPFQLASVEAGAVLGEIVGPMAFGEADRTSRRRRGHARAQPPLRSRLTHRGPGRRGPERRRRGRHGTSCATAIPTN